MKSGNFARVPKSLSGTFFLTMHRSVYGLGAIDPKCEIHVRTHSPVDVGTSKNLDVTK